MNYPIDLVRIGAEGIYSLFCLSRPAIKSKPQTDARKRSQPRAGHYDSYPSACEVAD